MTERRGAAMTPTRSSIPTASGSFPSPGAAGSRQNDVTMAALCDVTMCEGPSTVQPGRVDYRDNHRLMKWSPPGC